MITLKAIPRVKAGAQEVTGALTETNERSCLARSAAEVLGYKTLAEAVAGVRTLGIFTGKLTETLLRLEMDVLDASVVVDYQLEEAARRTKEVIIENLGQWTHGWFAVASWTHTRLSEYKRPVPEFVLDKAISIKTALPEVEFHIQHMSDPEADPFLIAVLGPEVYYIEAWDEPRFERGL